MEAYELINKKYKNTSLAIVSDGIIKDILKKKAKLLNIDNSITWAGQVKHTKVLQYFNNNDLIMLPSLRDSGGFVLLEAIKSVSIVAVCNLGGPGAIIDNTCGISIDVKNKNQAQVARDMSKSVIKLINDKKKYNNIKKKSHEKTKKLSWKNKIKKVYY